MNLKFILLSLVCLAASTISVSAQPSQNVIVHKFAYSDGALISRISDNGKWAVAQVGMSEAIPDGTPRIVNVDTQEDIPLTVGSVACDVSDDGNIVVGRYQGCPAWWDNAEGQWQVIAVPEPYNEGTFAAVTPDGHYAVGTFSNFQDYTEAPVLFDLVKQSVIQLKGLPKYSMSNTPLTQNRFVDISADARYILGVVQYSYPSPPELFSYVYDRETETYSVIGFDENPNGDWTPLAEDLFFTDEPVMSPNGRWVCGKAYISHDNAYSDFATEYYTAFRYNVLTREVEVYDNAVEDAGNPAFCIADNGELLGATPMTTPLRNWNVRRGAYWYPFAQIWRQHYNGSFESTNYEQTGTPVSISSDGTRIVCMVDPQGASYIAVLPENIYEAAGGVRLIANYIASPVEQSAFEYLGEVQVLFDREVQTLCKPSDIKLVDAGGKVVRQALYFSPDEVNGASVIIGFRPQRLAAGQSYRIIIPAGAVALVGDETQTSDEITLNYRGRAEGPVSIMGVYPEDHSVITKVDADESPILLLFDTNVQLTSAATAKLVRDGGDDDGTVVTPLYFEVKRNLVSVYPPAVVYLYDGEHYRIEIDEGSITDVMGEGGNERIVLHLTGNYVREIAQTDETIFADDFSNIAGSLNTYMLYDGDGKEPSAMMAEMEYTAETTSWNFSLRESAESTDIFAGSHSMYAQPGQSDDWMILPGLDIIDQWCTLEFDTQSYDPLKTDRLKVVALACDEVVNFADKAFVDRFKAEGTVLYDEIVSAGATKNQTGEWTPVSISLADFAGRMIYIAFVNQNDDQSMVFVDNIKVKRNLHYLIEVKTPASVVAKQEQQISGEILANSDNKRITAVHLTLKDTEGREIGTFSRQGLSMTKGQTLSFAFDEPLQLSVGNITTYVIDPTITMDSGETYGTPVTYRLKTLAFETQPHVVIEEMTGLDCGNCPLGILAFEHLERLYHGSIYPISIHTYTGDPYASGLENYTSYLNIIGAPTGVVNRNGTVLSPMSSSFGLYGDEINPTWADLARNIMEQLPEADIKAQVSLNTSTETMDIDIEVRSALNQSNVNYNLYAVVLEDDVRAYQHNFFANQVNVQLGEWASGGKYGKEYVRPYIHKDVARRFIGRSYAGTAGLLPQTMLSGESYHARLTDEIPQNLTIRDDGRDPLDYAKVVVVLLNANTGHIVNATCVPLTESNVAVTTPEAEDGDQTAAKRSWYGIDGRRLAQPQSGFCIERTVMRDGSVRSRKVYVK